MSLERILKFKGVIIIIIIILEAESKLNIYWLNIARINRFICLFAYGKGTKRKSNERLKFVLTRGTE